MIMKQCRTDRNGNPNNMPTPEDCGQPGTLQLLEEKISGIRQDTEEKAETVRRLRKRIAALKNELESAERDLKACQRNLSNARYAYERTKRPV